MHVWLDNCRRLSYIFGFVGLVRNEILQSQNPNESRAGIPSMRKPAWRDMISASVELCAT